jgi:integrase
MQKLKHLPLDQWPEADHEAFRVAYEPGDVFDETSGPGAHLAEGTRKLIRTAYRRWLGLLKEWYPSDLPKPPADRITPGRVRDLIDHLSAEIRSTSVANVVDNLCYAARLIAPDRDWRWLASIKRRLAASAKPEDRFDRLVPPWHTLDFGIELMDEALALHSAHRQREIQYRDGLLIALLSFWPIRRRSIAALTVTRHLEFDGNGFNILLYPEDTKSKRAESVRVPEQLVPYVKRYLDQIRPQLLGRSNHDGLWPSLKKRPLSPGRIYDIVRARVLTKFEKDMGLHDFRRAAATYVAMDAPEKIGLIPGVLQHASLDVSEHYNLAQSIEASRRLAGYLLKTRSRLRPLFKKNGD